MLRFIDVFPFRNIAVAELHRHVFFVVIRALSAIARDARNTMIGKVVGVRVRFAHPLLGHLPSTRPGIALASRFAKLSIVRIVFRIKVLFVASELLLSCSYQVQSDLMQVEP